MKNILASIIAILVLANCSTNSQDYLSKSQAKKAIEKESKYDGADLRITTVKTGFYEENDNDKRFILRKLAAAGVINYTAHRVAKPVRKAVTNKVVRNFYGYTYNDYQTSYKMVDEMKTFVEVSFTKSGNAFVLTEDMIKNKPESKYEHDKPRGEFPEDKVQEIEFPDDGQNYNKANITNTSSDDESAPSDMTQYKETNSSSSSEYEINKSKENFEEVEVLACKYKLVDVENIEVISGKAVLETIWETYDCTPFGRVIGLWNGKYYTSQSSLKYYQDKGWVLDK